MGNNNLTIQESCHLEPACVGAPFPECLPRSKVICPGLKERSRNRDEKDSSGGTKGFCPMNGERIKVFTWKIYISYKMFLIDNDVISNSKSKQQHK